MFYSNEVIDRADHLRKDDAALETLYKSDSAQLIPVWRGRFLVDVSSSASPTLLPISTSRCPSADTADIFLGLVNEQPLFARSVSSLEEAELGVWVSIATSDSQTNTTTDGVQTTARFEDLRTIGPTLNPADGAIAAYARGLIFWHDTCQFCSRCGSALDASQGGHVKLCRSDTCHYNSFPRTDPAVIMLVTRDATEQSPAQCLLGRNAAWPVGVFSTLAGFVETGESLEQAVQREVLEESSIRTENVRYIASQPWPFPRSIMLGFEATATSFDITIDPNELDDARWFNAAELKTFGTWGDEQYEFQLPRTDSIARFLIDRWIDEHDGKGA